MDKNPKRSAINTRKSAKKKTKIGNIFFNSDILCEYAFPTDPRFFETQSLVLQLLTSKTTSFNHGQVSRQDGVKPNLKIF